MDYRTYAQHALSIEGKAPDVNVPFPFLDDAMSVAIHASDLIDQLKKVIFYRRAPDLEALRSAVYHLKAYTSELDAALEAGVQLGADLPVETFCDFSRTNMRLLHHAFGRFGEAGELIAALHGHAAGNEFDTLNYIEEMGDGGWYDPIAYEVLGVSEECVRVCNLAKLLVVRYNKGFSGEAATNRKLASEREVIAWVIQAYLDNGMTDGNGDLVLAACRQRFCPPVEA